jgi:prolyl-tRNA editing enzyme YbaK/EbsC (Cys-tRNA(Pro) deacylase)
MWTEDLEACPPGRVSPIALACGGVSENNPEQQTGQQTGQQTEHRSVARFRAELEARGGTGRIVVLPESVHTAQLAADALGCEVGAIANSLLFEADGEPLLLLTSGAHRVDTGKVARELGIGALKRAKPEFVRTHTGQVIGGVSPFDHPAPVRTHLDPWLRRHDVVWAAAGHPAAVFSSTFEELQTMTGAGELDME